MSNEIGPVSQTMSQVGEVKNSMGHGLIEKFIGVYIGFYCEF